MTNSFMKQFEDAGVNIKEVKHSKDVDKVNIEVIFGNAENDGMKVKVGVYEKGSKF